MAGLAGGSGGLGGQHVAPTPEGEADGSHQCPCGDEVPQSEEVRVMGRGAEVGHCQPGTVHRLWPPEGVRRLLWGQGLWAGQCGLLSAGSKWTLPSRVEFPARETPGFPNSFPGGWGLMRGSNEAIVCLCVCLLMFTCRCVSVYMTL